MRKALPPIAPAMAKAIKAVPNPTLRFLMEEAKLFSSGDRLLWNFEEVRAELVRYAREHPELSDWRQVWEGLANQTHARALLRGRGAVLPAAAKFSVPAVFNVPPPVRVPLKAGDGLAAFRARCRRLQAPSDL